MLTFGDWTSISPGSDSVNSLEVPEYSFDLTSLDFDISSTDLVIPSIEGSTTSPSVSIPNTQG